MYSVDMMFNTADVAHRMRENGDVIPYVAPGMDTMRFLKKRTRRMTLLNVVFLLVLTVLPDAVCAWLNITSFSFFGTSLMIAISMLFDTSLRIRATCIHNDKRFILFPEFNSEIRMK